MLSDIAVIGSSALRTRIGDGFEFPVNDFDIVGSNRDLKNFSNVQHLVGFRPIDEGNKYFGVYKDDVKKTIVEMTIAYPGTIWEEFVNIVKNDPDTIHGIYMIPSLDILYLLKMSHRFLKNSPHFYKTMQDIRLMEYCDAKIPEKYQDFFNRLEKETYHYQHPKLNRSKEDFFDTPGVEYLYDHDSIHEAVKIFDRPAYKFFMKDGAEVQTDKDKFDKSSLDIKLAAVYEESCVLALERSLIPFPGGKTPIEAFQYALVKVCTSITSGYFREFAWRNHDDVNALFDTIRTRGFLYEESFRLGLENGTVKPFTGKSY